MSCRTMRSRKSKILARVLTLALILSWILRESAQAHNPKPTNAPAPPVESAKVAEPDPLGRDTPRSAATGFLRAIQRENYERAGEYLDSRRKGAELYELAQKLGVVLDRKLSTRLSALSDKAEGNLDDNFGPNRDLLGVIPSVSGEAKIFLDRVQRGNDRPLWLFSSESLQEVRRLYDEIELTWFERFVPEALRTRQWLSIPLYRWIGVPLSLLLILVVASVLTHLLIALLRAFVGRVTKEPDDRKITGIIWPLRLQVLAFLVYAISRYGPSVLARRFWAKVAVTLGILAITWLLIRLGNVITDLLTRRLLRLNRSADIMLVRLFNRLGKASLVIVCGLLLLSLGGFNLTAMLTGLGLGGIAIAFAAQKTLENLFGGIMLISDKPIHVGDFCRAGEFLGTVEDIGLRSTRLRTPERTIVSIPNGQLSTMSLENFTFRDRIRFRHLIGLRYETQTDQLRYVLAEIRRLLYEHSKVDSTDARVRFVGYGASSLQVEVLAYVLATDYAVFLGIQEDLLLRIMDIIETSGTSMAFPSQTTYLVGDTGLDAGRSQKAVEKIQSWREQSDLPFPDFPRKKIAEFEGTIDYPPAWSAVRTEVPSASAAETGQ